MNTKLPPLPKAYKVHNPSNSEPIPLFTVKQVLAYALAYGELVRAECLPAGWVAVPKEPTPEMVQAAFNRVELNGFPGFATGNEARRAIYSAMLSAAPPAQEPQPVQTDWQPMLDAVRYIELIEEIEWCRANGTMGHRTKAVLDEVLPIIRSAKPVLQTDGYTPQRIRAKIVKHNITIPPEAYAESDAAHPQPPSAPADIITLARAVIKTRWQYGWSTEVDDAIRALEVALQGEPADAQPSQRSTP